MWECGLKLYASVNIWIQLRHSLCGSVDWNEKGGKVENISTVTPYVGVWIETKPARYHLRTWRSLLMWECGLKPSPGRLSWRNFMSLLMWECGLKPVYWKLLLLNRQSHSLCGSVDWNPNRTCAMCMRTVTPYVGVWIETDCAIRSRMSRNCHSLCGSVDWNTLSACFLLNIHVTPYVGVWIET